MAKVSSTSETGEHTGCLVAGRILNASGQGGPASFSLKPERGALWRGMWYAPDATQVPVGADGRWSTVLVPSSVVGPYRVVIDGQRFEMTVPDAESARFETIATVMQDR